MFLKTALKLNIIGYYTYSFRKKQVFWCTNEKRHEENKCCNTLIDNGNNKTDAASKNKAELQKSRMSLSFLINFIFSKFKEVYEGKVKILQRKSKICYYFSYF